MRLGDLDDLKDHISELILVYSGTELEIAILNAIDNAPTVEAYPFEEAVVLARDSKEPTQFVHIRGGYDVDVSCKKCGYVTTTYALIEAEYCPKCGRPIVR